MQLKEIKEFVKKETDSQKFMEILENLPDGEYFLESCSENTSPSNKKTPRLTLIFKQKTR